MREEDSTIKKIKEEASRLEKGTREEVKVEEEREEFDAQIRKMENYFIGLEEIGSQIKKELEEELTSRIMEITKLRVESAFERLRECYQEEKKRGNRKEKEEQEDSEIAKRLKELDKKYEEAEELFKERKYKEAEKVILEVLRGRERNLRENH